VRVADRGPDVLEAAVVLMAVESLPPRRRGMVAVEQNYAARSGCRDAGALDRQAARRSGATSRFRFRPAVERVGSGSGKSGSVA
jgi:hypothetical protein